jgi:branched-chain amino acid transport system substrate-binding protein
MNMKMSPTTVAGLLLAGALVTSAHAQQAQTVKIGMLVMDAGNLAAISQEQLDAAKLAVEKINAEGGVNGKKLEIAVQSYAGTPAAAITAATRLAKQDGAKYITGLITSAVALALGPRMDQLGAIVVDPVSQAEDQIAAKCTPAYYRASTSDGMILNAIRGHLEKSKVERWDTISLDSVNGHDFSNNFAAIAKARGAQPGLSLFSPVGTADFGAFISQLKASPADGLAITLQGADAVAFAKQQHQFGLFKKYKQVMVNGFATDEQLPAIGEQVIGIERTVSYFNTLDFEKNKDFVQRFKQRYNRVPVYNNADTYIAIEVLGAAMKKAGTDELPAVRKALDGLRTNTIVGDVEMRAADHQLVRPQLLMKLVVNAQGKPEYQMIDVISGAKNTPPPSAACKMAS